MTVRRDFEALYRTDSDPWKIGDADSDRYNRYFDIIDTRVRGMVLDIGCGTGSFLARCDGADRLVGVEISPTAIEAGRARWPGIEFVAGSAGRMHEIPGLQSLHFDLIVCSDVIYYLPDAEKVRLLEWMAAHLTRDGAVFLAAWCPGGKYLTGAELGELARAEFVRLESHTFETSGHLAMLLRPRRRLAALTVDYETWQPIPPGKTIDWDADIFAPAQRLAAIGEACGVSVTFFVEMGEYFWLCANEPAVARRMEEQWRDLARKGHDLQLHLHPSWLPELGAAKTPDGWFWNWSLSKAHDYPGNLSEVIRRCKDALESVVRTVDPAYRVTCFRAGAYQAQPFERLYDALVANDIICDSSVYQGGYSTERGYDYRLARSSHQPYFASRVDPQFQASDSESTLVELPVFTYSPNSRCFIDGSEGGRFAGAFLACLQRKRGVGPRMQRVLNRLPRALRMLLAPQRETPADADDHFVLIGHTKAELDGDAILEGVRRLQQRGDVQFVSLSTLAREALDGLRSTAQAEARAAVSPQSSGWQRAIPLDRSDILVVGSSAGRRAQSLATSMPWARVRPERAAVACGSRLVQQTGAFDCIYCDDDADSVDPEQLREFKRLLRDGGVLVLSLPRLSGLGGLGPALRDAGFSGIETHRSVVRRSTDVRCSVAAGGYSEAVRARQAMTWLYEHVSPEHSHAAWRAGDILRDGHAYCAGYASALGQILSRDGYRVRWLSMEARGHLRGRGSDGLEHHEVISVVIDGRWVILDPMTNTLIPHDLKSLLARPDLAVAKVTPDARYATRGYQYYDTPYWYSRVVRYSFRVSPRIPALFWTRNKSDLLTTTLLDEASPAAQAGD